MAQPQNPASYGTVAGTGESRPGNGILNGNDESQALLGRKPKSESWLRKKLVVDARRDWADVMLLGCYIITGILDSASISTWGAFVSMQTGNTVYLGLGPTAGTNRWKKSGSSILAFCIGSFFFSRLHRMFSPSPTRKWVLCLSFAIQTLFVAGAAAIVTWGPKGAGPDDVPWYVITPIALVAFQSCGQAVASRALKYNALTSVVLTSIYCDLFSDAALFESVFVNAERNRRVAAPSLLLIGAIIGGLVQKSELGTAGALWLAVALKLVIMCGWAAWPAEQGL
ncbi:hypothetical protein NCS57_00479700 [Fusarium keratoplasticum]|uniref:Uncharacterized protein n=1 Tax=Fusarium keratoplasticum TaxID=1328300 RepID=A0ACC0R9Z7_9HYPO|nr:hypothetical protein NCS57_00479700 [Fusarium keratoplasticum]KAI8675776.1 hypothetical protein NCS57_00479700 [Fusarium keratoplasticum]KAI8682231.1 hypothetical protein NCS55_00478300 [Fusarium keratoplasticum]